MAGCVVCCLLLMVGGLLLVVCYLAFIGCCRLCICVCVQIFLFDHNLVSFPCIIVTVHAQTIECQTASE